MSGVYDEWHRVRNVAGLDVTSLLIKAVLVDVTDVSGTGGTISAASFATPINITTSAAHNLSTGDRVTIAGVLGNLAANGLFRITQVDSTNFTLDSSIGTGTYVSGGTLFDLSNDSNLSDIAAGGRVSTATVTNVSSAASGPVVIDVDDLTFAAVSGDESHAVLFYYDSTVEATSTLLACLDANTITGLPVTPGGGNIDLTISSTGLIRFN